ncbi:MAG: glucose 1-dehydrogenase [SAR202 cluster bacterium]|jgi:NAD(P)-dependent dehydrogenase (short-subunit alcohol dehydrogenase family)|nr:cyclopentanol dehydrogenase [Chloroflexota bacterium]MDP6421015.1 glucose 1-dehydrogenase [SAR202 cluster bacterium]MQG58383.1 glucose 1-dehydrogenase [SAR202 cluster bacterium]MQG67901.1 glucose 1-dehydrogenase [SAR202 cluster bacterium]HAL47297.1 cyclopentanol dehydrogenase [Dehalococcoidia bacterium]|tara:strand:+ start:6138 stop:6887 length:750 start_codon:yes stop_codon:yes gene_type:complete
MRLEGKVALISGGARGMGAVEAALFAEEGARVVIGDILEVEGQKLEAEINEAGGDALFVRLDVTSEEDWDRAVDTAVSRYGKLDILVNNAGVYERATVEETTSDSWDRIMDVNAKGSFLGVKAVIEPMRQAGGGSIVNISSGAGIVGSRGTSAYNASKGAVRLLTKAAAVQYAADGIRANSIHPGPIDTDMVNLAFPSPDERAERVMEIPAGRFGRAEEVAYGVLFVASDEASFMTGGELVIDGGATAI